MAIYRSLTSALRRLRFAVVLLCWLIALCQTTQLVVWSLTTFTDLRYAEPEAGSDAPVIVKPRRPRLQDFAQDDPRWNRSEEGEEYIYSIHDRLFGMVITVTCTLGLLGVVVIVPLVTLGVVLAVPTGANHVDRAVGALMWTIVLAALGLPLGGWFGLGWGEGTVVSYQQLTSAVDGARESGFSPMFYARFLILPALSAGGFVFTSFRFSAALEGILVRGLIDGVDPEIEAEASKVQPTSLYGTGRTAGALTQALKDKPKKSRKRSEDLAEAGKMPRRLI